MPLDSTTYVPSRQAELAEQARRERMSPYQMREGRRSLEHVLNNARREASIWLAALRDGRIQGSHYAGECRCLLGTIAKARGVWSGKGLSTSATMAIEALVCCIYRCDTPENHPIAALVAEWTEDWLARNGGGV